MGEINVSQHGGFCGRREIPEQVLEKLHSVRFCVDSWWDIGCHREQSTEGQYLLRKAVAQADEPIVPLFFWLALILKG